MHPNSSRPDPEDLLLSQQTHDSERQYLQVADLAECWEHSHLNTTPDEEDHPVNNNRYKMFSQVMQQMILLHTRVSPRNEELLKRLPFLQWKTGRTTRFSMKTNMCNMSLLCCWSMLPVEVAFVHRAHQFLDPWM